MTEDSAKVTGQPQQVSKLEVISGLESGSSLEQVQHLLQHAQDHDGYLSIGEHIYLKLRTGPHGDFEQKIRAGQEAAGALLAYLDFAEDSEEAYPEHGPEGGRRLAAYAQLLAQPHNYPSRLLGELVVHPHLRGHGIGRQLLERIIELGRLGHFTQVDLWSYYVNSQARGFADQSALKPSRTLHHMRRPVDKPLPPYELPPDLHVRAFRPGLDNVEWLTLNHLVFADHPENGSWTLADLKMRFSQPWFDPHDFLILEDATGRMVGFNWTKLHPARLSDLYLSPAYPEIAPRPATSISSSYAGSMGEIYIVGLHPDVRGRGLGRGLTLLGLQHLHARGANFFALYVDATNTAAVQLYHSLGFVVHHDDVSYTLPLDK